MPGAIWTTDSTGAVNANQYDSKKDVYLNGGPKSNGKPQNGHGKGLPDGGYYVKVTAPDGALLGNSVSTAVYVEGGEFEENYRLWDIVNKPDGSSGFADTTNDGGEYKVWVSQDSSFPSNESKTDNFSVITPSITVVKEASKEKARLGDTITYSYTVTNTGNAPLKNITVEDNKLGSVGINITELDPGDETTGTLQYTIQAGDLELETLDNTVTATGFYKQQEVEDTDEASVIITKAPPVSHPYISIVKTTSTGTAVIGDTVTYTYTVTNEGNTTLIEVSVIDDPLGTVDVGTAELAPGESAEGEITYTVQQEDLELENSELVNTVTASGTNGEQTVTATDNATVTILPEPAPAIKVVKEASTDEAEVGDSITYTYTITNTGNTDLTGITLVDDRLGNIALESNVLAEEEVLTATSNHTVTSSDPDPLENTATVNGYYGETSVSDKAYASVDIVSGGGNGSDNGGGHHREPDIEIIKEANVEEALVGDTVIYTYTVTNTGERKLTGITVEDDKLGNVTLEETELGTGESITGTLQYKVTEKDIGTLVNTAEARGQYRDEEVIDSAGESVMVKEPEQTGTPAEPPDTRPTPDTPQADQPEDAQPAPDLPFTGGNPAIYITLGAWLAGLGILLRKR